VSAGNSHGTVWRLAGPIILSNISVPLIGVVDTAVVGHLPGAHYIGAVAIGATVFSIVYWGFGFLRMGTTGLTAQALGSGDGDEVRAGLARGLVLAVVLGSIVLAAQAPLGWAAISLIAAGGPAADLADTYYSIRIWGAPAALVVYVFLGWFLGVRDTRAVLILQLVMNGTNMVLDLWFVFGLDLGVAGVALASLIAEVSAVAVAVLLARRPLARIAGRWRLDLVRQPDRMRRVILINRDIFIRTLCLISSFALFTALGARQGDTVLAVNAVLLQFQTFSAYGLDAFAHAVETLAGGAVGARDRPAFRAAVRTSTGWALGFALCFVVAYAALGGVIIDAITDIEAVRRAARDYMPWVVALPLVSVWSFQLDGIFLGATRAADLRNAMLISSAVYAVAALTLPLAFGNHGLWAALFVLMAMRTATLGSRYRRIERAVGP
jgi:multidrug resistance protein, MATE family